MTPCLQDAFDAVERPYLRGIVGRICSAGPDHISYPIHIPACDEWVVFRFNTEQVPRGGPAHRTFLEATAGPPRQVVSGDIAVVLMSSPLGEHALTTDKTDTFGILPVTHAKHFSKKRHRQLIALKLRGEPASLTEHR